MGGLSITDILKLKEFRVNYVGKTTLSLPSRGRDYMQSMSENNSRIYFSCFKADHYPTGRHGGISGVNGHHHKHIVWAGHNDLVGPTEWHQLGCGHLAKADYMIADKWSMGFATAVIRLDGYKYGPAPLINYHPVRDHANVEGIFFERQPHEYVETDYPNKLLKL